MATRRKPGTTFSDLVYDRLLEHFMQGFWEPNQQLNIPTIAIDFGVSQTPVREALARLEHTGIVSRSPLRGYRVAAKFTEQELNKLMDSRLVLEPALVVEAAQRVTPEFLDELKVTINRLETAARDDSFGEYWQADDAFHSLIARQAVNPFLETAYQTINGHVRRFRLHAKVGSATASRAAVEHGEIYEALTRRNVEDARQAAIRHIEGARSRALSDRKSIDHEA